MKTINFLEQYCRQTKSSLPVTTEVVYLIMNMKKWDLRRFDLLEHLLRMSMKDGYSALSINKDIVKLVLQDTQGEEIFAVMKKYNKPIPDWARWDPDCISLGVANLHLRANTVQEIFGIDSKARESLRRTESGLITMFKITDSVRYLEMALLCLGDPLPITSKVLKAAIQRTRYPIKHLKLLVRLLIEQQPSRVPEVINEEVLLTVAGIKQWAPSKMFKLLFRIRRQFNGPSLISSRLIDLSSKTNYSICRFLMREFSNENGIDSLRALFIPYRQTNYQYWFHGCRTQNIIGRKHLGSLLDEETLMLVSATAANTVYNRENIFKAIIPLHSL